MHSIENGNRPLVTTVKDGQELKLHIEAAPPFQANQLFQGRWQTRKTRTVFKGT